MIIMANSCHSRCPSRLSPASRPLSPRSPLAAAYNRQPLRSLFAGNRIPRRTGRTDCPLLKS